MTMNAPDIIPRAMTSGHSAKASNPKALRMEAPGTSISRPYLWSMSVRYLTSFTMRPSKP